MGWPGPVTHRQHAAWLAWLDLDMNTPSRTDHYIMQLTCVVQQMLHSEPDTLTPGTYRMRFHTVAVPDARPGAKVNARGGNGEGSGNGSNIMDTATADEVTYRSQLTWFAALGLPPPVMPDSMKAKLEAADGD